MSNFVDQLKMHINKEISFCLDDDDPIVDHKIIEVGEDYVKVIHGAIIRIIPISKITYIQKAC